MGSFLVFGGAADSPRVEPAPPVGEAPLAVEMVAPGWVPPCCPLARTGRDGQKITRWRAGVYQRSGAVCPLSMLDRAAGPWTEPHDPAAIDPAEVPARPGTAVYGGLLFHHFGHFLLESTNRLWWPLRHGFTGPILFQHTEPEQAVPAFIGRFFDLLGLAGQVVVTNRPLAFERIIVPERSMVIRHSIHRDFHLPFARAAAAVDAAGPGGDGGRVYLSRAHLPVRAASGEEAVEQDFARHGFTIAYPEELSLDRQIRLVRGCDTVAGLVGSAMHNLLFARRGTRVIHLCHTPTINRNYPLIDALMGNRACYLEQCAGLAPGVAWRYGDEVALDLALLFRRLPVCRRALDLAA
jgi:capsular polysaccharide biosynthesis protein